MAERQFMIVIRNEAGNVGAGGKIGGAGGIQNSQSGESAQKGAKLTNMEKAGNMLQKKMLGLVSYSAVSSAVNRVWTHQNSLVEVKTGSKLQAERQTYVYNNVSSIANSTIGGAIAGSAAGVPGAIVGAAIGFLSSAMSWATNYLMQTDTINHNRQLEDVTRQLTTQRVTISGSRYMSAAQM